MRHSFRAKARGSITSLSYQMSPLFQRHHVSLANGNQVRCRGSGRAPGRAGHSDLLPLTQSVPFAGGKRSPGDGSPPVSLLVSGVKEANLLG